MIEGLGEVCPLCIEAPDGRSKERRPPVFLVGCDGGYTGAVCAPHLAALIRAAEGKAEPKPKAEAKHEMKAEPKPAVPSGNGTPPPVPAGAK